MDEQPKVIIRKGPDGHDWYVVAQAVSLTVAQIPAGLLRTNGIPVRIFREAAGSSAIPLTVGFLANAEIAVPEAYYDEAQALLDDDDEWDSQQELESGEDD